MLRTPSFATKAVLLFVCSFAVLNCTAQVTTQTATVYGAVVSPENNPVEGASITIVSGSDGSVYSAISDLNGTFTIPSLAPGNYDIHVYAQNQGMAHGSLTVSDQPRVDVEVALNPSLNTTITVTSEGPVQPYLASQPLSIEVMREIPASERITRLEDRLTILPGVIENSSGMVNIDGMPADQNRWLLDELQINSLQPSAPNPQVPYLGIEQVQVIHTGLDDATIGPGAGGTISIIPREAGQSLKYDFDDPVPSPTFVQGFWVDNWRPRTDVCGRMGSGFSFCESAGIDYTRYLIVGLPQGQNNSSQWFGNNLSHIQWNGAREAVFGGVLIDRHLGNDLGLTPIDPISTTKTDKDSYNFGYLKYQHSIGSGLIEAGVSKFLETDSAVPQGEGLLLEYPTGYKGYNYQNERQGGQRTETLVQAVLPSFSFLGTHDVTAGVGANFSDLNTRETLTGVESFNIAGRPLGLTLFGADPNFGVTDSQRDGFLQDKWTPLRGLVVSGGVRWDSDEAIGASRVTPRANVAYLFPKTSIRVYASFSYVPQLVNPNLMTRPDQWRINESLTAQGLVTGRPSVDLYTIGKSTLSYPEMSNKTVGLSARLPGRVEFDAQYLQKRSDDGLSYGGTSPGAYAFPLPTGVPAKSSESVYSLTNNATFRYDGFSVSLRKRFCSECDLMVHYTYALATSNADYDLSDFSPFTYSNLNGRLPWDVRNRLVVGSRVPWRLWSFGAFLSYRSGMPYSLHYDNGGQFGASDGFTMPPQVFLNVEVARQISLPFRGRTKLFDLVLTFINVPNLANYNSVNSDLSAPQRFIGAQPRSYALSIRKPMHQRDESRSDVPASTSFN